jgi:hypothetical protein
MSNLPPPGTPAAPLPTYLPTLNRFGIVRFASDRPDLQGTSVQVVMYAGGLLRLYSNPHGHVLYEMPSATVSFEGGTQQTRKTPTWAIVVAIVGFFVIFVFSLLFLLVKETRSVPGGQTGRFVDQYGRTVLVSLL